MNIQQHLHNSNPTNRASPSFSIPNPSICYDPHRNPSPISPQKPTNNTNTPIMSLTTPSASASKTINPPKFTTHTIDTLITGRNKRSRKPEFNICERMALRSDNSGDHQIPQNHRIQNVIVDKQQGNSDSKSTAQVTGKNIQKSSNEVIRTSLPKMKYNFRNHNNINYRSKYAGHIDGTNNKKKKNSSQRKIGEER